MCPLFSKFCSIVPKGFFLVIHFLLLFRSYRSNLIPATIPLIEKYGNWFASLKYVKNFCQKVVLNLTRFANIQQLLGFSEITTLVVNKLRKKLFLNIRLPLMFWDKKVRYVKQKPRTHAFLCFTFSYHQSLTIAFYFFVLIC